MNHLFLFTITPVQDFISQSRKLLDLYGSSSILSCMSEIGIMICNREKGKTVFPYYDKKNSSNSYPNRFLVEFKDKNLDEIKKIAKLIEKSLQKFLRGLNSKNHQKIYEHIENYFSFYWAISEIENNDYKNAFDIVEKRLAGAKNTRFFTQLGNREGERGRKCSICGERNVTIYQNPLPMLKEQIDSDKPKKDKIAQKQEGLCGVCYIKRRYGKDRARFESTADIALINIFNELDKNDYSLLKKDPQLFFEENLTDTYFKKYGYRVKELSKYKEQYQQFQNDIKNSALKQTSYYAVIMFDGDNMGKWLSGEYIEESKLQDFHTFLSKKLIVFANSVQKMKDDNLVPIYAGGEDFLGFVNINYLFEILQLLRDRWNEIVNEPLKEEFNLNRDFTFSAGVVIAHYKTPLHEVLKRVRSSEKEAKSYFGKDKDAICLTALKRSGEIVEGVIKYDNIKTLQKILDELKENFLDGFISVLDREFNLIEQNGIRIRRQIKAEIKRLLKRAKLKDDYSIDKIEKNIEKSFIGSNNNFKNFVNILYFIRFIKREIK